jgi:hypothetical protein
MGGNGEKLTWESKEEQKLTRRELKRMALRELQIGS